MFDESDLPVKPKGPKPLDTMSIGELEDYVAALKAEIDRTQAAITAKRAHAEAASALFGGKTA